MREIASTLVTDGRSDRVLLHILDWVWRQHGVMPRGEWFDPYRLPRRPSGLVDRLAQALRSFPCDVLMVHRDAEGQPPETRRQEIVSAVRQAAVTDPHVCVVPVRMTEAWLLFNESAIRKAAGNPCGTQPLSVPPLRGIEGHPDPKRVLVGALRTASGLAGRRLSKLNFGEARHRLAEALTDYSPLRVLPAFQQLEADVQRFLAAGVTKEPLPNRRPAPRGDERLRGWRRRRRPPPPPPRRSGRGAHHSWGSQRARGRLRLPAPPAPVPR